MCDLVEPKDMLVRSEANLVTSYFGAKAYQVDYSPSSRGEYNVVPYLTPVSDDGDNGVCPNPR